jgi:catechol 2,3-dioxygenase-like lactoylglutathione lyase family enzyme
MMRIAHISLTARNADRLAQFYRDAFGLVDRRPPRTLSGATTRGTGVHDAEMRSVWLCFPGTPHPFLEILGYTPSQQADPRPVNAPGWGHIALEVGDLRATLDAALRLGGSLQGQITTLQGPEHVFETVYLRDPEGNVIELEQLVDG